MHQTSKTVPHIGYLWSRGKYLRFYYLHLKFNGLAPSYLSELLEVYVPMRMLRSSSAQLLLFEPKFNLKTYGSHAFSVCVPRLWNSLPLEITGSVTLLIPLRVNLRLIFLRVHTLVSFYLHISIIISIIIFLEFVKRSWTL